MSKNRTSISLVTWCTQTITWRICLKLIGWLGVAEREEKERLEQERREADEQAYQEKLAKLEEQQAKQRAREQEIEERQRRKVEEAVSTRG